VSTPGSGRVVVVGGGIAGLAAARALAVSELRAAGSGPAVVLCEATPRLGGHVRSVREADLLVEAGPDSMVTRKPAAVELCRELGLGEELVTARATHPAAQVVRRGRLHDLPEGSLLALPIGLGAILGTPLYSPRGKARLLAERFVAARRPGGVRNAADGAAADAVEDEALGELVTRRLGREAFERAVEPVFGGLFAGDAARFSTRLVAPRLLELEARWGSFTSAARAERRAAELAAGAARSSSAAAAPTQVSLRNGMEDLVRAIARELQGGAAIGRDGNGAASGRRVVV
jgi:oxygen-dependent protoporphyrinogen oxidase